MLELPADWQIDGSAIQQTRLATAESHGSVSNEWFDLYDRYLYISDGRHLFLVDKRVNLKCCSCENIE